MTLVLSVNTLSEIVLAADSRLSGTDSRGQVGVKQDICQKVFLGNYWSVTGFAGQLRMARHLLHGLLARLQQQPEDRSWLRDDDEIRRFLKQGIDNHGKLRIGRSRLDHRLCRREPVELMICWVDHERDFRGIERDPTSPEAPPRLETVIIRSPSLDIARRPYGVVAIGSGSVISEAMYKEAYLDISWHAKGLEHEKMHRSFMSAIIARSLLTEKPIESVGDALQLAYIDVFGVQVIPYFYWVPVGKDHGTYFAMRIENGEWIQEHRPTDTRMRLMSPFEFQLFHPTWKAGNHKAFDPARFLSPESPGVIPKRDGQLVYHLYDPDIVPEEIQNSWGTDPLEPITWADNLKSPPKRFRP